MNKENQGINKKWIVIFLIGVFLLSGTVSYAYFTAQTKSEGAGEVTTEVTTVKEDNRLVTEGELTFDDKDIYPGHKSISSIKVTAYGDIEINYNVIWTGTSSFTTSLKYYIYKTTTNETPSITCDKKTGLVDNVTTYYEECTNNGFDNLGNVVASGEIPTLTESTKIELIKNESIQATSEGNTVYYYVVIEYPNKEEGQNADFNASINGEVSTEITKPAVSDTILAGKTIIEMSTEITGISTDTSNTLYSVADDDGTSYVYRGNPSNNWVQFGGFYWRIIRVNGDGTVRLIYNGTTTTTKGTGTQINGSEYAYNSSYNDNAYVGFMYGEVGASAYEATHTNTNNSTIKEALDSWYTSNLASYESYIDTNAGFCNDRTTSSTAHSSYGTLGYGTNVTAYAPWGRLYENGSWKTTQTPSLKCPNASSDLFTPTGSNKGNKKLTNPVGLITIDEVVFAGGFGGTANNSYYLYTNQYYWTMSPYGFNGSRALVLLVHSNGGFIGNNVNVTYGVRPVINLKSDVTLTGTGTSEDPYLIS